jgi:hypothetical protein
VQEGKKDWLTDEKMDTKKTERGKRQIKEKLMGLQDLQFTANRSWL